MGYYRDRAKAERRSRRMKKRILDFRFGVSDANLKKKKPCKKKVKK